MERFIKPVDHCYLCEDWILWEDNESLLHLLEQDEVENTSASIQEHDTANIVLPVLNRPQYNAVLKRFNDASKHAGTFAAWKN